MSKCLAIFGSKTQVYEFNEILQSKGIPSKIINTPTQANLGCGQCVEFLYAHISYASQYINAYNLNTFRGFYTVNQDGLRTTVRKL